MPPANGFTRGTTRVARDPRNENAIRETMARLMHKTVGGIELVGTSMAGEESVLIAPEYDVAFDVGRAPREIISINNVCLTHGHMDHAAGIAYYFSQRGFVGLPPGRMIAHRSLVPSIERLMEVWREIEGHPSAGRVVGVDALQDVELRRGLLVRPFFVNHGGYALGYSLIEVRHKLRAEFADKTGPELVALKRQGVQIEHFVEVTLVTYSGDTTIGRYLEHDFVRRSRIALFECTFFERDHISRAKAGKHMFVDDLPKVFEAMPEAQIVLIHVTRRTDLRDAKRALRKVLRPSDLDRASFFMDRPPRELGSPPQLDRADADSGNPNAPQGRAAARELHG